MLLSTNARWKPKQIRVWSLGYLRFWIVKTLIRSNPLVLLTGGRSHTSTSSPLHVLYLKALGAKKVSILAPYMKPLTQLVIEYIENEEIEVIDSISLEIPDNLEVGRQDPLAPAEITKRLKTDGVDAIVASACVQMPSLPSVQLIEDRTGLPVVSSSVSTTYMMLRKLGLKTASPGFGSLLSGRY